jgi:hypothetical protein
MPQSEILAVAEILVFDFKFFIGARCDLLVGSLAACEDERGPHNPAATVQKG